MQYPYRVVFGDPPGIHTYVLHANDSRQAVRRAMREYRREQSALNPFTPPENPQGRIWVRSLVPKKVGDLFYPRVGGFVIEESPRATEQEAVEIAIQESLVMAQRRADSDGTDSVPGG